MFRSSLIDAGGETSDGIASHSGVGFQLPVEILTISHLEVKSLGQGTANKNMIMCWDLGINSR